MPWYDWLFVALAIYGVIGVASAVFFSQTPYGYDGWLWIVLFWPLFWFALIWG